VFCKSVSLTAHLKDSHPDYEKPAETTPSKVGKWGKLANKDPTTKSKFKCQICSKTFADETKLNNHQNNGKRFYCLSCDAVFCQLKALQEHQEIC